MKWIRRTGWLIGVVFVALLTNAYALWSVNRPLAIANLVLDALILVYSVVAGYRSSPKEQL